jgi:hypothetical protein
MARYWLRWTIWSVSICTHPTRFTASDIDWESGCAPAYLCRSKPWQCKASERNASREYGSIFAEGVFKSVVPYILVEP